MYESLVLCTIALNIAADFLDRRIAPSGELYSLALWTAIIQFLLILPMIGLVKIMPWRSILLCAAIGAFSAFGRIAWYRALASHNQTLSRLAPFVRLSSVLALLAAFFLLGEPFTYAKAIGGLMMVLGSLLIIMDNPAASLREFLNHNRDAALATIFALSIASISVTYKSLLNSHIDLFTVYFFLKTFQVLSFISYSVLNETFVSTFRNISHLRVLVAGRVLQTVAALIYLLALSRLDLSVVEPIAALGPLMVFGIEIATGHHRAWPRGDGKSIWLSRMMIVHFVSLVIVGVGIFLLSRRS